MLVKLLIHIHLWCSAGHGHARPPILSRGWLLTCPHTAPTPPAPYAPIPLASPQPPALPYPVTHVRHHVRVRREGCHQLPPRPPDGRTRQRPRAHAQTNQPRQRAAGGGHVLGVMSGRGCAESLTSA